MKKLITLAAVLAVTLGVGVGIAENDLEGGNSLKRGNSLSVTQGNSL
ncbi:MAG: hypothetical protein ABWX96_21865 [Propionibacteriaceae bacterium]